MKKILTIICMLSIGCANVTGANKTKTTILKAPELNSEVEKLDFNENDLAVIKVEKSENKAGDNGELQTFLYKNEPAPYDGILLNPEATAFIITEYESLLLRSNLALEQQRSLDLNKLNLETKKLQLEIDANEKKSNVLLQGKEEEINRYKDLNKKLFDNQNKHWKQFFIITGVFIAGAAAGYTISDLAQ